ncbi:MULTISPECIES: hypothetical protein [unclassified Methylosinus]|uniref:hypothetical protein n=1 Tax=unclassified Methylosinus TaxID=2624500 RepID=UPI001064BD0F|nr:MULTISPECIES: hypothetical protein [unclassified Methylosinus]
MTTETKEEQDPTDFFKGLVGLIYISTGVFLGIMHLLKAINFVDTFGFLALYSIVITYFALTVLFISYIIYTNLDIFRKYVMTRYVKNGDAGMKILLTFVFLIVLAAVVLPTWKFGFLQIIRNFVERGESRVLVTVHLAIAFLVFASWSGVCVLDISRKNAEPKN